MDDFVRRLHQTTDSSEEAASSTDPVRILELHALFETYLPTATEAEIHQVESIQEDLHQLHVRLEQLLQRKVISKKEYARTVNTETVWAMRRCAQILGRQRCEQLFGDDALDEKSHLISERIVNPLRKTSHAKRDTPGIRASASKPARAAIGRSKGYLMKPMIPSVTLAEVVGSKAIPRTEVTKKLWAYIKKNGLQDKKNKRMINGDDKLRAVFGGKASVNMFVMTKLVSKHLK